MKQNIVDVESFKNNEITEFFKSDDDERKSLNFINFNVKKKSIYFKARRKDTSIEIRINDPELMILLNEYYAKQVEISARVQRYLDRGAQESLNVLENLNESQYKRSIFRFFTGILSHILIILFSISLIIFPLAYYTEIARFLGLESQLWFLFYYVTCGLISQKEYQDGLIKLEKYKVYKNENKSFKINKEEYRFKFREQNKQPK